MISKLVEDLDMAAVAGRLGKSVRWLRQKLADDARKPLADQRFQVHHYIGRDRRWTETTYLALRAAIIAADTADRRLPGSSSATATGTFQPAFESRTVESASARVQAYRPGPTSSRTPKRSATSGSARSDGTQSTGSSRPSRSGLRLINT